MNILSKTFYFFPIFLFYFSFLPTFRLCFRVGNNRKCFITSRAGGRGWGWGGGCGGVVLAKMLTMDIKQIGYRTN